MPNGNLHLDKFSLIFIIFSVGRNRNGRRAREIKTNLFIVNVAWDYFIMGCRGMKKWWQECIRADLKVNSPVKLLPLECCLYRPTVKSEVKKNIIKSYTNQFRIDLLQNQTITMYKHIMKCNGREHRSRSRMRELFNLSCKKILLLHITFKFLWMN